MTKVCFSRQNFHRDKHLFVTTFCHGKLTYMLQQKTSQQKHACYDGSFVATNTCLSQQTHVCHDNIFCCDKHDFVFCHGKHTFAMTRDTFCHNTFVTTKCLWPDKTFVVTKTILVAAPANDISLSIRTTTSTATPKFFFLSICQMQQDVLVDTEWSSPAAMSVGRCLPEAWPDLATAWLTCLVGPAGETSSGAQGTAWFQHPLDLGDCTRHGLLVHSNNSVSTHQVHPSVSMHITVISQCQYTSHQSVIIYITVSVNTHHSHQNTCSSVSVNSVNTHHIHQC